MSHEVDCWTRWLLRSRFRGPHGQETLEFLAAIRDRVLDRAQLQHGAFVLDVGSGDGLLAFGALPRVAPDGIVIVDDISQDTLDACAQLARAIAATERMRFVRNSATDLRDVPDAAVDAVVTRSALAYVPDKACAAAEFRRVLRPGGRVSLFEPLLRHADQLPRFGIDPGPLAPLATRVEQTFRAMQPPEAAALLEFDERDLLAIFEAAGFTDLDLDLHIHVRRERKDPTWFESLLEGSGHPRIPSLRAVIAEALSPGEAATYVAYYRNVIATSWVVTRQAHVYLSGTVHA